MTGIRSDWRELLDRGGSIAEVAEAFIDEHFPEEYFDLDEKELSSKIQTEWGPHYFVRWLFYQETYWLSADGVLHTVSTMNIRHALNVLLFLERTAPQIAVYVGKSAAPHVWLVDTPLYKAIKARIVATLEIGEDD